MKIDELKSEMTTARLNRDQFKLTILSTIIGNLMSNAKMIDGIKTVSDDDVIAYLKKYSKGVEETLSFQESEDSRKELEYVNSFLPKQLSEDELLKIWDQISAINVGDYMKYLKANFFGQYDGKMASNVAKLKSN